METPRLYGTPLSHFTRKIRILLVEFNVDFEFVRVPSVLATAAVAYGDNPLMRVPTLVHEGNTIIDSEHIARYLVGRYDPADRFGVRSEVVRDLNRLAVINGIMANEVVLILAERGGLSDLSNITYFRKLRTAIDSGLAWLENLTDPEEDSFLYVDIALICMWQHIVHYKSAPDLEQYPRIVARVGRFSARLSVARTTPEASLAEAARIDRP
jgi:glutathione S-transferase